MKDFLTTLAIWIVIMFLGLFFLGGFFLSGRHVYGATLVLSLVPATVPHLSTASRKSWNSCGSG